jgi:hypothetical protein
MTRVIIGNNVVMKSPKVKSSRPPSSAYRQLLMDVRHIRRSLAWIHPISILTRDRIPAYRGQDESGSCHNVYELQNASHRWHMESGDR